MAQVLEDVAYLSQDIGPRPASTEEEQSAATYIAQQLEQGAGFQAEIEDFKCVPDFSVVKLICFTLSLVAALLAFFVNITAIPAVIVGLVSAGLYLAEAYGQPVLSRAFNRGVSQNVVAKYQPPLSGQRARRRKVILVASYDSTRVMPELNSNFVKTLPIFLRASVVALIVVPLVGLIKALFFVQTGNIAELICNIILVIGMLLILLNIVRFVVHRAQQYNDAANCNAAGVAVLLDVARRIGNGQVSVSELSNSGVTIHGEEAARKEGLIPEGVQLTYEASQMAGPDLGPQTEEERLAAAKAAIAALTGKPVEGAAAISSVGDNLVKFDPELPQDNPEARGEQNREIRSAFTGGAQVDSTDSDAIDIESIEVPETQEAVHHGAEVEAGGTAEVKTETIQSPEEGVSTKSETSGSAEGRERAAAVGATAAEEISEVLTEAANAVSKTASSVPEWFRKAQQLAKRDKKPADTSKYRSRFAAVLDQTEERLKEQEEEAARELETLHRAEISKRIEDARNRSAQQANQVATEKAEKSEQVAQEKQSDQRTTEVYLESELEADASTDASVAQTQDVVPDTALSTSKTTNKTAVQAVSEATVGTNGTVDFAPLDVSDLMAEVQEIGTAEPQAPAFIDQGLGSDGEAGRDDAPGVAPAFADPDAPFVPATDIETPVSSEVARRSVVLPTIADANTALPIAEASKQRAPLADVTENNSKKAARSLLSTILPEVGATSNEEKVESLKAAKDNLVNLPSLSGELNAIAMAQDDIAEEGTVSATGSFATVGATGSIAPVGDELVADMAPEEIYVQDADDSDYDENFTETGAFAGPGYVEMPKSRVQKFFDKLGLRRKKKADEEVSAHEWLDVDEDFDARTVGKERGGWESFRNDEVAGNDTHTNYAYDDQPFDAEDAAEDFTQEYIDEHQGAYEADGHNAVYDDDYYYDDDYVDDRDNTEVGHTASFDPLTGEYSDDDDFNDLAEEQGRSNRKAKKGLFSRRGKWEGGAASTSDSEDEAIASEEGHNDEVSKIFQFRNPDIDTEVWFVALGASCSDNAGMKDFLQKHHSELKGAVVINLEGLGAGKLTAVQKEGSLRVFNASSRVKRSIRKASQSTGISYATNETCWQDTPATVAMSHRIQAMSLVGMKDNLPAYKGSSQDQLDVVEEETLLSNSDFVTSMVKNI